MMIFFAITADFKHLTIFVSFCFCSIVIIVTVFLAHTGCVTTLKPTEANPTYKKFYLFFAAYRVRLSVKYRLQCNIRLFGIFRLRDFAS